MPPADVPYVLHTHAREQTFTQNACVLCDSRIGMYISYRRLSVGRLVVVVGVYIYMRAAMYYIYCRFHGILLTAAIVRLRYLLKSIRNLQIYNINTRE